MTSYGVGHMPGKKNMKTHDGTCREIAMALHELHGVVWHGMLMSTCTAGYLMNLVMHP